MNALTIVALITGGLIAIGALITGNSFNIGVSGNLELAEINFWIGVLFISIGFSILGIFGATRFR
ncbi:MAG: hypothetical protein MPJ78_20405 [Hyphomicrobiaceae bacterium]|nr:hypothetical protein [Hyphomicrobiaceae bacterium]